MHNQKAIFSNHGVHMTFKFKVAAAAVAFLAIGAAQAQKAPEPNYTLSANVGAVSQYRFRGIEQTSGAPALQAAVDFAHKNGFYAGLFTSNVTWVRDVNGASKGNQELDLFVGFKSELAKDLTVDVGYIHYKFIDNDSGERGTRGAGSWANADTNEGYVGLTYGIFNAKMSQSYGNFLGNIRSDASTYYELNATFDLGNGLTLVPHVGRQTIKPTTNADYTDYSLALNKDFGKGWSASLTAIATSADDRAGAFYRTVPASNPDRVDRFLGSSTAVLGVKYTF
jgi:uncharacterized protein (TIGR02001 family)